jgi:trehalose synthase
MGEAEQACYERVVAVNVAEMIDLIAPDDIVLLHDPQTARAWSMARARGVRVVWRCHVGRDETERAWAFLAPDRLVVDPAIATRSRPRTANSIHVPSPPSWTPSDWSPAPD